MNRSLLTLTLLLVLAAGTDVRAQNASIYDYEGDIYTDRGPFTKYDTLRGSINPLRFFDVKHYDLTVQVNPGDSTIRGRCTWTFVPTQPIRALQIDLMSEYMTIDKVTDPARPQIPKLPTMIDSNVAIVTWMGRLEVGKRYRMQIDYHGTPRVAPRAPWDGGFSWQTDDNGKPLVGVSCEGFGASSWWPLKDHLSDEPDDGMRMTYYVPDTLVAVGNGRLTKSAFAPQTDPHFQSLEGYHGYTWVVNNPINSYNVSLYIGDYVHIHDEMAGQNGKLDLDHWVLNGHAEKAKKHFEQVKPMIACFENVFGPYAFYDDSYKLVETSYWGMEHQSAIAYGNKYRNNDWGFDYIIIHESGHEWYGNNISTEDHAELWIHESFTTYSEALYVECLQGYDKMEAYLQSQRASIVNSDAILGPRGVNFNAWDNSDMYYKGSWMLHTLRKIHHAKVMQEFRESGRQQTLNQPSGHKQFKQMLVKMNAAFHLQTVNSDDVIQFVNQALSHDYTPFFAQYLAYKDIPTLEWRVEQLVPGSYYDLSYRLSADVESLSMPVYVQTDIGGSHILPNAGAKWQTARIDLADTDNVAPTALEDDTFLIHTQQVGRYDE